MRARAALCALALMALALALPAQVRADMAAPADNPAAQAPAPLRAPGLLRVATYSPALSRNGPGLLLRDILSDSDPQVEAVVRVVALAAPDILLLTGIDYDGGHAALTALADRLAASGASYPHRFAWMPNAGLPTGLDLDGDGRTGTPDDAHGYGPFAGARGMAILSRLPVDTAAARDFSGFLWRDLPGSLYPELAAPGPAAQAVQRLSSTGHWDVPVLLPGPPGAARLHLLAFQAGPPVFGAVAGHNLRRNHDEVRFWHLFLDGALPMPPPPAPYVLLGGSNLDPADGDGMRAAMAALLAHPRLQDPAPRSAGAPAALGPRDAGHRGDPARDTTHWPQPRGPGNLRVDYVLPSADLGLAGSGVLWPGPEDGGPLTPDTVALASRHRLVWVDLILPAPLPVPAD